MAVLRNLKLIFKKNCSYFWATFAKNGLLFGPLSEQIGLLLFQHLVTLNLLWACFSEASLQQKTFSGVAFRSLLKSLENRPNVDVVVVVIVVVRRRVRQSVSESTDTLNALQFCSLLLRLSFFSFRNGQELIRRHFKMTFFVNWSRRGRIV